MNGEELELDNWLKTLELMSMYEQYFTKEELADLTLQADSKQQKEWEALVVEANALFKAGESSSSETAQNLASRWMLTLEQNTAANPEWLVKLNSMHSAESAFQEKLGVHPEVVEFLLEAFAESKLNVFARYLSEQEFAFMKQNYAREMKNWPQLLIGLEKAIHAGIEPDSEQAKCLAQQWLSMLQGYAGKIRRHMRRFAMPCKMNQVLPRNLAQTYHFAIFRKSSISFNALCLVHAYLYSNNQSSMATP